MSASRGTCHGFLGLYFYHLRCRAILDGCLYPFRFADKKIFLQLLSVNGELDFYNQITNNIKSCAKENHQLRPLLLLFLKQCWFIVKKISLRNYFPILDEIILYFLIKYTSLNLVFILHNIYLIYINIILNRIKTSLLIDTIFILSNKNWLEYQTWHKKVINGTVYDTS